MSTPAPRERVELTPGDLTMLRRVEARRQRDEARQVKVAALVARVKATARPQGLTQTWEA